MLDLTPSSKSANRNFVKLVCCPLRVEELDSHAGNLCSTITFDFGSIDRSKEGSFFDGPADGCALRRENDTWISITDLFLDSA